jgi:flagellar motor switch protein FliG
LENFLNEFKELYLSESALLALGISKPKFHWKEILHWEIFWKEQIIRHLRANTLAVLLVTLDEDFRKLFFEYATPKQKNIILDELFYLNQGVNNRDSNPNTKNISLQESERAFLEFKSLVENLKKKRNEEAIARKREYFKN